MEELKQLPFSARTEKKIPNPFFSFSVEEPAES